MFGYVTINRGELKVRELETYESYYCGLCRVLKDHYGLAGCTMLNYDMTFLGMLLSSLFPLEHGSFDHRTYLGRCKHDVSYLRLSDGFFF